MSEQFETLFKNLAKGMSRRAALRRFFGGIAGAAAFALTGRRAAADEDGACAKWCAEEFRDAGPAWVAACINQSQECGPGQCCQMAAISWGGGDDGSGGGITLFRGRPYSSTCTCVQI